MTGSNDLTSVACIMPFTTRDGLRLHAVRDRGESRGTTPVLCLAGLTRNGRDFNFLAQALSKEGELKRDVWRLDYRGRGKSDHDPNWRNYAPFIELLDTLDFLTAMGLDRIALVATSRGGIIAMLMAALRPTALAAVVLNDIGPVLEPGGLARIAGYVGKTGTPDTWEDAAAILKAINAPFFPNLTNDDWHALARQWFWDKDGKPAPAYDPQLARSFTQYGRGHALPALWPQFAALSRVPVLVLRGANSDLLSEETVENMKARHPALEAVTVPDEGHAPLLRDPPTIAIIRRFLARLDSPVDRGSTASHDANQGIAAPALKAKRKARRSRRSAR